MLFPVDRCVMKTTGCFSQYSGAGKSTASFTLHSIKHIMFFASSKDLVKFVARAFIVALQEFGVRSDIRFPDI